MIILAREHVKRWPEEGPCFSFALSRPLGL